ncbi:MAG: hypothetical protein OHK0045_19590 [Raineya sp.]
MAAFSYSYAQNDNKMTIVSQSTQLQEHIGKEIILEGIMQMRKFVNKGGQEMDFYEFYIELADGKRILLRNKTGNPLSKEPFTHKVHLKGKLFYGNIDSNEPKAQSRLGYRFDFTGWKIIERR